MNTLTKQTAEIVGTVAENATTEHEGRRWARLTVIEDAVGQIEHRRLRLMVRSAKIVTAEVDGECLVRVFGEASRITSAPPPPTPAKPRGLETLDLVVEIFEPGPEAALQLVRAGATHPTAIPHRGEPWAQVAVLSIAAPWIHRVILEAEEAGLVTRGGMSSPGGRYVILARPAPPAPVQRV